MHGRSQPALDERSVRLEMKLQAVNTVTDPEGLVGTLVGLREMLGTVRQSKRVAVPLK